MTLGETNKNLPWVEKYRPSKLEDLVSHEDIIKTINQFMNEDQLPHLLFYGPPGTGKTSTILACAKKMYTPQQFNSMVLELNASDDRGIGIVRGQILSFASTRTIFKAGPKMIILDEADAMTNDAQNALRRMKKVFEPEPKKPLMALFGNKSDLEHQRAVRLSSVQKLASQHLLENFKGSARTGEMVTTAFTNLVARVVGPKVQRLPLGVNGRSTAVSEASQEKRPSPLPLIEKYTENVRFCIICNYLGKIIPALQSRCTRFRFAPLNPNQILPRLQEIATTEGVKISDDGMKALMTLSGGDMRKVLNTLQSTWLAFRDVTEDNVYTCVGHPLRSDINNILNWLLNENDFTTCFTHIQNLKINKGLALSDILTEIHTVIQRVKLPPEVVVSLLIKMSEAEARLASGCSEKIELAALIATFQIARDHISLQADAS